MDQLTAPALDETALPLDPFGLVPDWISAIRGLGGDVPGFDAAYVFHTPYMDFGSGEVVFRLRFDDLRVTEGILVLRVNAYPDAPGAVAYQVSIDEVLLRGIMIDEGQSAIRFSPLPRTRYALLGHIYSDTDAIAAGLSITAHRVSAVDAEADRITAARRTAFEEPGLRPVARLVANHMPSFTHPVSQMATSGQFAEPACREWIDRLGLGLSGGPDGEAWRLAFILQALRQYGVLAEGASGLGLGVGGEPLPALMAALGCKILATDPSLDGDARRQALRRPDICPDDLFDQRVTLRSLDLRDAAEDLVGFDFLWSSSAHAALGSIPLCAGFIKESILRLKPGGVAVFTTPFNLSSNADTIESGAEILFRRADFERLALALIGNGHEVAQFSFVSDEGTPAVEMVAPEAEDGAGRAYQSTPFGMIIRRGLRVR